MKLEATGLPSFVSLTFKAIDSKRKETWYVHT